MKGKVQISRSSWHYKLHCFVFTFFNWEKSGCGPLNAGKALLRKRSLWQHNPTSICGYFWSTLFLGLLFPLFAAVLIGLCLIIAPFAAIFLAGEWVHGRYRKLRPKPQDAPPGRLERAAGFTFDYVVATKQKHCPLIELTD